MKVFLFGLHGFFHLNRLRFVKKQHLHGDTYSFYFSTKHLRHRAGQHGMFIIPRLGVFGLRLFSLSSAPEEKHVMITTHVGSTSRFKKKLMSLKPGEVIRMFGPFLFFFLRPKVTDYVFLAQGIGITPFRSLLLHIEKQKLAIQTTLVHVGKDSFPFRDQTERAATHSHYVLSPEAFTATVEALQKNPQQLYFISGSPRFVRSTKELLRRLGIKRSRIKSDNFFGY